MGDVLRHLAERQFGVISREQALAAGLTRSGIDWRLACGEWQPVFRSVYRLTGAPTTWSQRALAALLATGPRSALSHRSAGHLFALDGLADCAPTTIEVTVPRGGYANFDGLLMHRSIHSFRVVQQRGLWVTSITRTLMDLARNLPESGLELALDSAQRRFPRVGDWLQRDLSALGPRCGYVATLRRLLALRTGDPATDSPLEVRVRRLLRTSRLPRPRAGHSVFDRLGFVMRVDFAWPAHLVALHVDGYRWHHQRARFERDARQRSRLAALGWTALTVTRDSVEDLAWLTLLATTLAKRDPQRRLPLATRQYVAESNTNG